MRTSVLLAALLILLVSVPGQAFGLTGEVRAGLQIERDIDLKLRPLPTGLLLAYETNLPFGGKLHLSTKAQRAWHYNDGGMWLNQAFLSGYAGNVDYVLGRHVICWGTADGFNPTNYFGRINASDALLTGDVDGSSLWAGQISYYAPRWSATVVAVPFFSPQRLNFSTQKMMLDASPEGKRIISAVENAPVPKKIGKDSEFGFRLETNMGNFDVQASCFSGYEPLPGLELALTMHPLLGLPKKMETLGTYRRQNFVGLATAGTVGSLGVWSEVRLGGPQSFEKTDAPWVIKHPLSVNKGYVFAVLGGDYTLPFGSGLLTQLQYIYQSQGSLFTPYAKPNQTLDGAHYLYGRLSYDFMPGISGELVLVHGFTEESGLARRALTYHSYQGLQVELSSVKTYGEGDVGTVKPLTSLAVKYVF